MSQRCDVFATRKGTSDDKSSLLKTSDSNISLSVQYAFALTAVETVHCYAATGAQRRPFAVDIRQDANDSRSGDADVVAPLRYR